MPRLADRDTDQLMQADEDGDAGPRSCSASCSTAASPGMCFPVEYGGQGLTRAHQQVFTEESAPYEMPILFNVPTLSILAPTLFDFGTEEQKQRHLPAIISRRGALGAVPVRAVRGIRPGRPGDPGHPRRRRVRPQRVEDLELGRLPVRLRPLPGPDRLARAQAPGPDHVHRQDPPAGDRGPADQDGQRLERVLPGVLRRRGHPGRERGGRGQRRVDGGLPPALPRARRGRRRLALHQRVVGGRGGHGGRATNWSSWRGRSGQATIPTCASWWPRPGQRPWSVRSWSAG